MIVSRNLHIVCILLSIVTNFFVNCSCNGLSVLSVKGMDGCGPPEVEVILVSVHFVPTIF